MGADMSSLRTAKEANATNELNPPPPPPPPPFGGSCLRWSMSYVTGRPSGVGRLSRCGHEAQPSSANPRACVRQGNTIKLLCIVLQKVY